MIKSVLFVAVILATSGEVCKPSYGRGVGTIPQGCPDNAPDYDTGLCYIECKKGYDAVGPVCWERCKQEETDDGAFCRIPLIIVAKKSYGRGAGTIPNQCPAGKENQDGLCYDRCQSGYSAAGPVCWEHCAPGYADHGATCYKSIIDFYGKKSYGRGAGTIPDQCPAGQENQNGLCYNRCSSGYYGEGPVCWEICNGIDHGTLCEIQSLSTRAKNSYGRGAGVIRNQCNNEEELDTGLCYKYCEDHFHGIGPVCWNNNFPETAQIVAASAPIASTLATTCSLDIVYNAITDAIDFNSLLSADFKDVDLCLLGKLVESISGSWSPEKTAIGIKVALQGHIAGGIVGFLTDKDNYFGFDTAIDFINNYKQIKPNDFKDEEISDFIFEFLQFFFDNFISTGGFNIYIGIAFKPNNDLNGMDIYWYYGSCDSFVLDIVSAENKYITIVHRSIGDIIGTETYFSLGLETPFVEAGFGVEYIINGECEVIGVGSYISIGAGLVPIISIEGGKCNTPKVIQINNNAPPPMSESRDYVKINFERIGILTTNVDSQIGGTNEEWRPNNDYGNSIKMNVDFIDYLNSWNDCVFNINEIKNAGGGNCNPKESTTSSTPFYDCFIQGAPQILVPTYVFENGLIYDFDFQIGDYDANNVFDNGPIWDFIYKEPKHVSINDLPQTRYFTKKGEEGRRARLFVTYELVKDYIPENFNLKTCKIEHDKCVVNERIDCGAAGITENECELKGCCYDESIENVPRCFYGNEKECAVNRRIECGWKGITPGECLSNGCCYEKIKHLDVPWCFYGN